MADIYRPEFSREVKIWKEIIKLARKQGAQNTLDRLNNNFHKSKVEETPEKLTFETWSTKIKTLEDLIAYHEIDTKIWEADRQKANYWEQGAKIDGQIITTPLHQINASFIKKKEIETFEALKAELIQSIKDAAPTLPLPKYPKTTENKGIVVELMITDFHLGKIAIDYNTNEYTWSLQEAKSTYLALIENVLHEVKQLKTEVNHFILPTGNDFLNIDNSKNETTKGTPQMTAAFWKHLFRFGKEMIITAAQRLSEVAPVKIIMVEGNHDKDSTFSLGESLDAYFHKSKSISVDNNYSKRKYHTFGEVLIGYFHFDEAKPSKAHNAIISDVPHYAHKKFKTIHGGHYHKNMKLTLHPTKDENYGIEVEVCPSLCPTDQWHYEKLYVGNQRRSKTFFWHPTNGLIKELYFNL